MKIVPVNHLVKCASSDALAVAAKEVVEDAMELADLMGYSHSLAEDYHVECLSVELPKG
ncbi:MAG: hypothetical protein WC390_10110 [Sulfurimonas sp.]